jgi:hypothetical protein
MSSINPNTARRGELFLIEEGVWSTRRTLTYFRVLRNFDPIERLKAFTNLHPDMANPLNAEGFIYWLEFRQPRKLVSKARSSILSLGDLPYGASSFPPEFRRIGPSQDPNPPKET